MVPGVYKCLAAIVPIPDKCSRRFTMLQIYFGYRFRDKDIVSRTSLSMVLTNTCNVESRKLVCSRIFLILGSGTRILRKILGLPAFSPTLLPSSIQVEVLRLFWTPSYFKTLAPLHSGSHRKPSFDDGNSETHFSVDRAPSCTSLREEQYCLSNSFMLSEAWAASRIRRC